MRILLIGSGAREHALARGLYGADNELHIVPGNAGMEDLGTLHTGNIESPEEMADLASSLKAELVVIGPENPLVAGVADAIRDRGIAVFGPSKAAAQLEGSKAFAKEVMEAAGVRTARALSLAPGASEADIEAALAQFGPTYVVKDDGLAAGKGVVVTPDIEAARAHIHAVHEIGHPVLLESFLDGPEVSLFCFVDGETVIPLQPAQDHKRAYDGDKGPNTGGMGAYTPLSWLPEGAVERIVREVCEPVAREMVSRGTPYSGLLYAGLAWGSEGPAVVEFNCRFGDPETQAVLAMLETPLIEPLYATATGTLSSLPPLSWRDGYALTVVLAAHGYPESVRKGDPISLPPLSESSPQAYILHAGTRRDSSGQLVSAGGRVLSIVATGDSLEQARDHAYALIEKIELPGSHYRSDIALPAVKGLIHV